MSTKPETVVSFWRDAGSKKWFQKSDAFDAQIESNFLELIVSARAGCHDDWIDQPESCLALILVLDQFPRNVFRGTADMFASDAKAVETARAAIAHGHDKAIDPTMRAFVYMPFMHSEAPEEQATSVELFTALGAAANLKHALEHAEIVARFGRFPHRNAILGRVSTAEEITFLTNGGFAG